MNAEELKTLRQRVDLAAQLEQEIGDVDRTIRRMEASPNWVVGVTLESAGLDHPGVVLPIFSSAMGDQTDLTAGFRRQQTEALLDALRRHLETLQRALEAL